MEIDGMLESEASGKAGAMVRRAKGFYTETVQKVRGDVEEYEAALEEYLESPDLFVARMWEKTRRKVLQYNEVKKHFGTGDEWRIKIGPDPRQREIDETRRLQEEAAKHRFEPKGKLHAVSP
jgi:hypothetical protein